MLSYNSIIPLFPLNTVLFPGMMLPLHIFEERYKAMIKECLGSDEPFGVILAKTKQAQTPGADKIEIDDLYTVGTTANITAVERLKGGRINLIAVGQDRFIVKEIQRSSKQFFVGQVDPFPIQPEELSKKVNGLAQKLRPMLRRYIDHLADASGEDFSNAELPTDPTSLVFLTGTAIQGPLVDKQKLLSTKSLSSLISKAVSTLDREDQILVYMLRAHQAHQQIPKLPFVDYSLN